MSAGQGVPLNRVVAVLADLESGQEQIGSGYLVGKGLVLTAEHCTRDMKTGLAARSLQVVNASSGKTADATLRAASQDVDTAVLEFADLWDLGDLPMPVFGQVDRTRAGEIHNCQAIGFPLWQYEPSAAHRGTAELSGTIRRTDDADSGYLLLRDPQLITVASPKLEGTTSETLSPWSGFSGALVFHAGVAIGVIVKQEPRQGSAAVRLVPFDRIAARSSDKTRQVADALGLPSATRLAFVGDETPPSGPSKDVRELRRILAKAIKEGNSIERDASSSMVFTMWKRAGSLLPETTGDKTPSLEGVQMRYERWCRDTTEDLQRTFGTADAIRNFQEASPTEVGTDEYIKLIHEVKAKVSTLEAIVYSLPPAARRRPPRRGR